LKSDWLDFEQAGLTTLARTAWHIKYFWKKLETLDTGGPLLLDFRLFESKTRGATT
jgi:hypothetical protein